MNQLEQCDLCRAKGGRLDFNHVCCRVRFLLKMPHVEIRRAWIDYWRRRDGDTMATEIENEVTARWAERNRA
ncbi:hypothetical protein [Cupriavidus basilensis]|uniref:hypothetical protein n=1 Tax=Cupriavidus basilensis TaxID=68895 RepID=UPI0020A62CAF|nr:hypothetical protein [Cupriavidus basilensis]MCP3017526.1 hypothetical protein [Cupriavidus basilensis]